MRGAIETSLHRLWLCPANDGIDDPAIRESDFLKDKAVADDGRNALLLGRSLVPLRLLDLPPPPEQRGKVVLRCEKPGELPGGTYGVDGSGGVFSSSKLLRRVAWSFARLEVLADGHFGWSNACTGIGDGGLQTTPRAELLAIIELMREVRKDQELLVVSDHANHVKAFARGRDYSLRLNNADLWWELWGLHAERTVDMSMLHCPPTGARSPRSSIRLTGGSSLAMSSSMPWPMP